jgi:hypothetical protein
MPSRASKAGRGAAEEASQRSCSTSLAELSSAQHAKLGQLIWSICTVEFLIELQESRLKVKQKEQ